MSSPNKRQRLEGPGSPALCEEGDDLEQQQQQLEQEDDLEQQQGEEGLDGQPLDEGDVGLEVEGIEEEGAEEGLPSDLIDGLAALQAELERVNDEASEAVLAVECRYNAVRRPIYARRSAHTRRIPCFWLTAFENCAELAARISDADAEALRYLEDVDVEDFADVKSGFRITMRFREGNPYFGRAKLTKQYRFVPHAAAADADQDGGGGGAGVSLQVEGAEIDWYPGKALVPERRGEQRSFFRWLAGGPYRGSHPRQAGGGGGGDYLQQQQQQDDEGEDEGYYADAIADAIRERVWPDPLRYYCGVGEQEEGGHGVGGHGGQQEGEVEEAYGEEGEGQQYDDDDEEGEEQQQYGVGEEEGEEQQQYGEEEEGEERQQYGGGEEEGEERQQQYDGDDPGGYGNGNDEGGSGDLGSKQGQQQQLYEDSGYQHDEEDNEQSLQGLEEFDEDASRMRSGSEEAGERGGGGVWREGGGDAGEEGGDAGQAQAEQKTK